MSANLYEDISSKEGGLEATYYNKQRKVKQRNYIDWTSCYMEIFY